MIQDINGTLKELQDKDKIQNVLSQGVNVFLSSTYIDLVEERKSVHDFLENMGCHVIWMEDFAPQQRPPIKVCLSQLGECKIYVCIIKKRYGSLEDQTNKSMTQLEYERARGMNIKRCILIADSEYPVKVKEIDDWESLKRLAEFQKIVEQENTIAKFNSIDELKGKVWNGVKNAILELHEDEFSDTVMQNERKNADISLSFDVTRRYQLDDVVFIHGTVTNDSVKKIYLSLIQSSEFEKEDNPTPYLIVPENDGILSLQTYGNKYLEIPVVNQEWKARVELYPLIHQHLNKSPYYLLVCIEKPEPRLCLESYCISPINITSPFIAISSLNSTIRKGEIFEVQGIVTTPQPYLHIWIFGERGFYASTTCKQHDGTCTWRIPEEELKRFSIGKQYFGIIYAPIKSKKGNVHLELINNELYFVRCDDFGEIIPESEILVEDNCDGVKLAYDVCNLLEEASGLYVKFSFIRE